MLVEVALPLPLPRTFTYRVPGGSARPGTRVRVAFGPRKLMGWIVAAGSESTDAAKIRDVDALLETEPSLAPDVLDLCRWVSDYYVLPLGQVLRTALPAVLGGGVEIDEPAKTRRVLRLTRELPSLQEREEMFKRAQRQRELYEVVEALGGTDDVAHLTTQLGFSYAIIKGLVARELATIVEERVDRDPFASMPVNAANTFTLTQQQQQAYKRLADVSLDRDRELARPVLQRGETGSGKTAVYIELLKEVVKQQNKGAIVLVPEISLTPQTVARFRAEFGDIIAVLHSALSDGERFDAWRALHEGEKRIAIGARSAVFAPVKDLGAIILDEEHESSYKQSESPRYHARDLAVIRSRLTGAVCLLGSATPSLESWHNVQQGKFELIELPERVEGRPLPPVDVVDLRIKETRAATDSHILSKRLTDAVWQRLERQ